MTISIVEERLDALFSGEQPKILILTGGWGTGKTHQWKQALQRSAKAGQWTRYTYVSLFGLTSLAEVRKRVAEETVAALKVPGKVETLGEVIEGGGWRLKPLQIMKLLPVMPYLGKLEGLANELSFSLVRNSVVCFDDLERSGPSLRLADVFGLASFLKEERQCKVVMIFNQEKLCIEDKNEHLLYLEKVVDEFVNLAPTPVEACEIALGPAPDTARTLLLERVSELGISNIRVIGRLSGMASDLSVLLSNFHDRVLRDAIQTLTIFGAAQFLSAEGFPSFDHLMKQEASWASYFENPKKAGEETEEDRKLARWSALLEQYKYDHTSYFDAEIGRSVQRGFFNKEALVPLAKELSVGFEAEVLREKLVAVWRKFWHSLDGSGNQVLSELRDAITRAITVIGLDDLQAAYEVFSQAEQPKVAIELLELFIAKNQGRPTVFDMVDGAFSDSFKGPFAERIRAEKERLKSKASVEEALDRIDVSQSWNSEDIRVVGKADANEIETLLRNSQGKIFRARVRALLQIGAFPDAQEGEKRVSQLTLEILKRLASEDPVTAIRLRQYIPTDTTQEAK